MTGLRLHDVIPSSSGMPLLVPDIVRFTLVTKACRRMRDYSSLWIDQLGGDISRAAFQTTSEASSHQAPSHVLCHVL